MNEKQKLLSILPSVDEILKSKQGMEWLSTYPRRYVLQAIRETIDSRRKEIIECRSILSKRALENIKQVSESYSNLEYNIKEGKRGMNQ
ncbi:MAG: hypothetical protein GW873_02675 [Nitrospirae bacterium]|nr:hypothetical protein [Nitrospirota bacterium]